MVHSVGEVAVQVPGGTEHRLIPIRLAPVGVRAGVEFTRIRLDFGDPNRHNPIGIGALKHAAKNFRCDIEHVSGEETSTC